MYDFTTDSFVLRDDLTPEVVSANGSNLISSGAASRQGPREARLKGGAAERGMITSEKQ